MEDWYGLFIPHSNIAITLERNAGISNETPELDITNTPDKKNFQTPFHLALSIQQSTHHPTPQQIYTRKKNLRQSPSHNPPSFSPLTPMPPTPHLLKLPNLALAPPSRPLSTSKTAEESGEGVALAGNEAVVFGGVFVWGGCGCGRL